MRKRCNRTKRIVGHILLPKQVQEMVMPLHMAVKLLPLGLFSRDHADHLAKMINVVFVDACEKDDVAVDNARKAGETLTGMYRRVRDGKAWGATTREREILKTSILEIDRHIRRMTTNRLMLASATIDRLNEEAKAKGYKFLDMAPVVNEKGN